MDRSKTCTRVGQAGSLRRIGNPPRSLFATGLRADSVMQPAQRGDTGSEASDRKSSSFGGLIADNRSPSSSPAVGPQPRGACPLCAQHQASAQAGERGSQTTETFSPRPRGACPLCAQHQASAQAGERGSPNNGNFSAAAERSVSVVRATSRKTDSK
jgi:hypothetical protein